MNPVHATNPGNEALHLAKAEEYLGAAAMLLDGRHFDAAASSASIAGIRASDAICAATLSRRWTGDDHNGAVGLLAAAGPTGATGARLLKSLLPMKNRNQYGLQEFTDDQASRAVQMASDLVALARQVVTDRGASSNG